MTYIFFSLEAPIVIANPMDVKNNEVPTKSAIWKSITSLVNAFSPSANAENISEAPLPNANKVTPATDWEHENLSEMADKDGDKNSSAVNPST